MARGQKTGGRQRGTPNRLTIEREIRAAHGVVAAAETGLLPIDVLPARMRDENLPNGQKVTDAQFEAAVAAAPYLHPRLAASTVNANGKGVIVDLSPEQRRAEIERLLRKRQAVLGPVIDGTVDATS
jgi:hypothetical protein